MKRCMGHGEWHNPYESKSAGSSPESRSYVRASTLVPRVQGVIPGGASRRRPCHCSDAQLHVTLVSIDSCPTKCPSQPTSLWMIVEPVRPVDSCPESFNPYAHLLTTTPSLRSSQSQHPAQDPSQRVLVYFLGRGRKPLSFWVSIDSAETPGAPKSDDHCASTESPL